MSCLAAAATVLLAAELLDPLALPWRGGGRRFRLRPRSAVGWPFRAGPALLLFGIALLVFGRPVAAAAAAAVLLGGGVVGSNAKHRVLGEPLCFTDLALLREMVRHPGFYLGAIPILARVLVLGSLVGGGVLLVLGASRDAAPRMVGAGLMVASLGVVPLARRGPWAAVAVVPDLADDVRRHGLLAALSLYPLRRRGEAPLRPLAVGEAGRGEEAPLVVVVQCESFADPGWMRWPAGVAAPALPGLEAARARAHRTGRLAVSGFGAYTMRTEYGVLFGRGEAELGFRRFDPFLSVGAAERGSALPRRLPNGKQRPAVFVHPHALGFYGRDRLMPAIGFDRVIGEDGFGNAPLRGPHVADAALGDVLERLLDRRDGEEAPRLVYAVTIENHGPWRAGRLPGSPDALGAWFEHLRAGDALLSRLVARLERDGRRAVLCFFGDHRPSIPGAVRPGPDRDTPFVLMRFGWNGERGTDAAEERLTPAELHHAILAAAGIDAGEEGGGGG